MPWKRISAYTSRLVSKEKVEVLLEPKISLLERETIEKQRPARSGALQTAFPNTNKTFVRFKRLLVLPRLYLREWSHTYLLGSNKKYALLLSCLLQGVLQRVEKYGTAAGDEMDNAKKVHRSG